MRTKCDRVFINYAINSNTVYNFSVSISLTKYMQEMDIETKDISGSTIISVLSFLGIDVSEFAAASVARTVETSNGVETVNDTSVPKTVLKAKHAKALLRASQHFDDKWDESMAVPIGAISGRFGSLRTGDRHVVVTPRVPSEAVTVLHARLEEIDPAYSPAVYSKDHLKKVPKINAFIDLHVVSLFVG